MSGVEMQAFEGTSRQWNALLAEIPGAHLLQTWEWAQVKGDFGWQPMPFVWRMATGSDSEAQENPPGARPVIAAAMVLRRPVISRGFLRRLCVLYVPKGPLLDLRQSDQWTQVLLDLEALGRKQGAILVKIDPDVELGRGYPGGDLHTDDPAGAMWQGLLKARGWRSSDAQIQFRNSAWIDLSVTADQLLARMKPKTRYNIGLAERKGIKVRTGGVEDIPLLFRMYAETADRDGFVIRSEDYYRSVWHTFLAASGTGGLPAAEALVAEMEGEPVAALLLFYFAQRAYYLYGMSRTTHRDKMPNHLLQWQGIQRAQQRGCHTYDLWGAPDIFRDSDSMWGVFRFKEGLGGQVVRTVGAWDYPSGGLWYQLYTRLVPRALDVLRWRGRRRVQSTLDGV